MVKRTSFAEMQCSVAQALEVVGEWWTPLILRDAFFGVTRFEEWQGRLGIARNVLAARLDGLVDAGVLARQVYDEGRDRADYVLTDKGRALWPVLTALREWGDAWITGAGSEPVAMVHTTCGEATRAVPHCEHCGDDLEHGELRMIDGPGAPEPSLVRR